MEGIYLLLGSNLGDREQFLELAQTAIKNQLGPITNSSSIHESRAWGLTDQPDFLNQVVQINTPLNPFELLNKIQQIEIELGRVRFEKWGPRIIDIDILYYHQRTIETEALTIPHPGIPNRRFTLEPLNEICPDFIHPVLQRSNAELLKICKDTLGVDPLLEA